MASTLAPRPLARQRLIFCCRALSIHKRSIGHSHQDHGEPPAGLIASETPGSRKTRPRSTWEKEICLWDGGQRLGVMPMAKVMSEFLRPGKTLSWLMADEVLRRPGRESSRLADGGKVETSTSARNKPNTDIMHYNIVSIAETEKKPNGSIRRVVRDKGVLRVFFRSNTLFAPGPGHRQLSDAYNILADPQMAARYPVEFHISPPRSRKSTYDIKWALHNRVDLRPEVIMSAMPYGVRCTTAVQIKEDGSGAFFTLVAKSYDPEIHHPPEDKEQPHAPGKPNPTRAATSTQAQPSPQLQMNFERALKRNLQKTRAAIHRKFQKSLETTVKRRLKKFKGGPPTPLPEEISKMQERERAKIEQAIPKVRARLARSFGIRTDLTGVAKDDPVDGSKGVVSSPVSDSRSS